MVIMRPKHSQVLAAGDDPGTFLDAGMFDETNLQDTLRHLTTVISLGVPGIGVASQIAEKGRQCVNENCAPHLLNDTLRIDADTTTKVYDHIKRFFRWFD